MAIERQTRGGKPGPASVAPPSAPAAPRGGADLQSRRHAGQDRAGHAWKMVEEAKGLGERYITLARKLPSYLQNSGLGQTFAFLHDRGKGGDKTVPEGRLLVQLGEHLARHLGRPAQTSPMELMLALDPVEYRRATQELMLLAEWLKRFAAGGQ